jgi:enoyl-CoA hydratase/carnithine racemase
MSEPVLLKSESGGILEVVLNRPEKLNAINHEMWAGIRDAVEEFRTNPALRVLLFRAKGRYFSAGADLTDYDGGFGDSPAGARNWMRRQLGQGMHRTLEEMEKIEKPIVVAHHAMCIGGSLELSLSCDFRVAGASAQYWFPEIQFGMVPLSGGISRLTRIIGPHWAKWMSVANMRVSAERALAMGLVHEVYPDDQLEAETRKFCEMLAGHPVEATAAGLLAIELCADLPSDQARQVERLTFSSLTFARGYTEMHERIINRLGGSGRSDGSPA